MSLVRVGRGAVLLVAAVFLLSVLAAPALAHAEGVFVPATSRVDHILDDAGRILYITNGQQILRWDLSSRTFLTPFQPAGAGQLGGMDASPDGKTLVVADSAFDSTYRWIHLVDVVTGASRRVLIPDAGGEAGVSSVACGSDGRILITTHYNGSGWTPLRRYDPVTEQLTVLTGSWGLSDGAVLAASADRSVIFCAETSSSDGPWGRYRVSDGTWVRRSGYTDGTSHFNTDVAASPDGSQVAFTTYFGTFVYNPLYSLLTVVGQYAGPQPAGVAYSPTKKLVFFPWTGTTKVRAYDTSTFTQLDEYDFGTTFTAPGAGWTYSTGHAKTSAAGRFLTVSVAGGVRYMAFNEPPSFVGSGSVTVAEDSGAYGGAWASSMSPGPACESSQTLTFTATNSRNDLFSDQPTVSADGRLAFTPAPDAHGSALVTVTLTDDAMDGGRPASRASTLTITVTAVNDAPRTCDDTVTATEDTPQVFDSTGFLLNDIEVDGDSTSFSLASTPSHGTLTRFIGMRYIYRPNTDFHGIDSFTYRASDGTTLSQPATVTIQVSPVNDPPTFVAGPAVVVGEDSGSYAAAWASGIGSGAANESQLLTFAATSSPAAPFAIEPSLDAGGVLRFAPAANANGSAVVTVTLTDDGTCGGAALSHVETLAITILAVDDPPVGSADTAVTFEDGRLTVGAPGVLADDSDVEGEPLEATLVTGPQHGRLSLSEDGSYVYTPERDFNGEDAFEYVVSDQTSVAVAPTPVRISVHPVNDPPVAVGDVAEAAFQTTLTVDAPGVLANDTDVDSTSLTATLSAPPSHGSVVLGADGRYAYVPAPGFSGGDAFSYRAGDGALLSAATTVIVTVRPRPSTLYAEVSGSDRFSTSAAASARAFPDGARTVVIATGRGWPDALGASALAGVLDAPLLLVDTHSIPTSVSAEISRLQATEAVVVGGPAAVGDDVVELLSQGLSVRRVAGADRYATASAVASETIARLGTGFGGTAFVTTGLNFPDALAASPLAAGLGQPIYLVRPGDIPFNTIADLRRHRVSEVVLLGGTAALPQSIEDVFVACLGPEKVMRIGGANRYETASLVAALGASKGLRYDGVAVATGEDFPDGLAGGVMQGRARGVLILTPSASLAPATADALIRERDDVAHLLYLGTTRAVGQSVREQVRDILQ